MKYFKIFAIAVAMLWSVGAWADAAAFIKRGDALFAQRVQAGKAAAAIQEYQKALAVDPNMIEGYWKISKTYYWIGTHVKDNAKKLKAFHDGIEFGKMCIQVAPKEPACHYWLGVAYGKYGEAKGIMQSLYLIPFMKKELNAVIKMKPSFRHYGAYGVLGWVYFKVPGIAGGSKTKALELLGKAVKNGPEHLVDQLFYAKVLLNQDKKAEAIKHLKYIINAPFEPDMKPENKEEKAEAKKLLKKVQGK